MTNKIGENIYKLRKLRNLTQQQLSEIIGVSIAAISKWETGSAYPDIELMPKIASIFDVSIDYFFDYHINSADRNTVIAKARQLSEERQYSAAISILSEAMLRYPNDMAVKLERAANMIYSAVNTPLDSERSNILLNEANRDLREVINKSESRDLIDEGYYFLGMSYINLKDFDKAVEAINQIRRSNHTYPGIALLRLYLEKGDIESAKKQYEINVFFSIVQIHASTIWVSQVFQDDLEKAILFYEMAIGAFKAYSGNNSCRFDVHISEFYERVAMEYTKVKDFDKAVNSLKLAVAYAHSYDNLQTENDLPQFDKLDANDTSWDKIYNQKLRLWNKIQSSINDDYKILSDRNDFIELILKLKNAASSEDVG